MSASVAPNNKRTAMIMAAVVAGMLALAFASVPLYRIFCERTGFGGTRIVDMLVGEQLPRIC